jgi:DNA-binding NarL/FixJ family response regulator
LIEILIADDQPLVRAGLRAILETQEDMHVVGEAADGSEAIELSQRFSPDVVLMDIRMPGQDGIEASRRLSTEPNAPRILILTTFDLDDYVYEAMKAGASGFLLKDAPREQLIGAVRMIHAGDALLAPTITRRFIEEFVRRPHPGAAGQTEISNLSSRESEVLKLVARGLSNSEIASQLFLSDATVKSHLAHILTKLGLHSRVQAVVAAYESGLVQAGGD